MYLGTQHITGYDWPAYQQLAQLGINHVSANPPGDWRSWTVETLRSFKARLAEVGVALEMILLPLGSRSAQENDAPHVFLGSSAERDRELDQICTLIDHLGQAGIQAARYNITVLGHLRTEDQIGRGGARLSSFVYDKLDQSVAPHPAGPIDADEMWARIDHFLSRVVPVAEAAKVRLACHPNDPGLGGRSYRGVASVLDTVAGLKKFVALHESPYHGLNFCQGTICEMLAKPAEEIFDVIRYFGERQKIFNIHLRNIKGGYLNFVEVFPDEGDIDLLRSLRTYQEVGYRYMIMPDHVPELVGPAPDAVGFAYSFGYLRALLQRVDAENPM
jgi:mannonate dehydratase